jgi:hypothetical protein
MLPDEQLNRPKTPRINKTGITLKVRKASLNLNICAMASN